MVTRPSLSVRIARYCAVISRRFSSSEFSDAVVHLRGDKNYGSREYLLLPPHIPLEEEATYKIASIHAHRNILFNARSFRAGFSVRQVCPSLVEAALSDAAQQGEQPQAVSTLHGLSSWVRDCLEGKGESKILLELKGDPVVFEAVKAIALGDPRPGHSTVAAGTFRDGQSGWEALANEFVRVRNSEECLLYMDAGAEFVGIEYLADQRPEYLNSAGGAMARLFFV